MDPYKDFLDKLLFTRDRYGDIFYSRSKGEDYIFSVRYDSIFVEHPEKIVALIVGLGRYHGLIVESFFGFNCDKFTVKIRKTYTPTRRDVESCTLTFTVDRAIHATWDYYPKEME